jgi:hypothetical protein
MKTIKPIILFMILIAFFTSFAQQSPIKGVSDGTAIANRDVLFECLPNPVFSQISQTIDDGYWGDSNHPTAGNIELVDDYTATGSFSKMRFWGGNFFGCGMGSAENFTIRVYERDPNTLLPGALFWSGTFSVTPHDIGQTYWWLDTPGYMVDIDLGTSISLLDGWVSITRQNPGDNCAFAGLIDDEVGGNAGYIHNGVYGNYGLAGDLNICLGGGTPTPISPIALILGIVLIGTAIVLRTRRYF